MSAQKGFAPLIIIIIATLVIGAGVGGFLIYQKQKISSSLTRPVESPLQQNQSTAEKTKMWPYDVPYNTLVSHILSNNLSAEDKAVLQSSLDDMKSGENQGPYWDEVRVATSKDGFTFEDTRRVVATHASVPAAVVDNQGRIWLFYVDFDPEPIERLIRGEKVDFKAGFQGLAAAVSDDGFTFQKVDLEIQNIVQGVAVDPEIVVAEDGTFQMYYLGVPALELAPDSGDPARAPGPHNIYLATAKSDLSKWQQQGVAWVGPHGGADPVVWQINDKIYYIASGGYGKSTDGGYSFKETQDTEFPLVNNGGPPGTPDILKVEGGYRLFHATRMGIKSFLSKDGISWQEEEGVRGEGADPTVVKRKDGTYLMYYKAKMQQNQLQFQQQNAEAGQSEQLNSNFPYFHKVHIATSKDGKTWNRSDQPTVEHASVADLLLLEKQTGNFSAGTLFLYFVDATGLKDSPGTEKIGIMHSVDNGKTWSKKEVIEIKGAEGHIPVDPSMVQLDDGTIRLYYLDFTAMQTRTEDKSKDKFSIYVASSKDGKVWNLEQLAFQYNSVITDPKVVYFKNKWYMYLAQYGMRVAASEDGLSFTYAGVTNLWPNPPSVAVIDGSVEIYRCGPGGLQKAVSKDGLHFGEIESVPQQPSSFCNPDRVRLWDGSFVSS